LDAVGTALATVATLKTTNPSDFATYVGNVTNADLGKVKEMTGYSTAEASWTYPLDADTDAKKDEYRKAAIYAVIKGLQETVDAGNRDIKTRNDLKKNGNKNIATVQYDNKFNGEGAYKTITDETKLYSVNLDLTKVALDNKIIDRPVYVASLSTSTAEADRVNVGTSEAPKYVMRKKNSTLLTTTDPTEADAPPVYVTGVTAAASKAAAQKENGQYVYVTTNEKETTLDVSEAKTEANKYSDDFEHTPVLGAIFELREVYASNVAAAGQRVQGVAGKHSRGLAITNSQGKLMLLEAGDPTTTQPTLDTITAPATDYAVNDVVYYTTIDDNGTTKYVPYKYTNKAAWEKLGEGTYELEEIEAPSGYKQWKGVSTFTITAENDGATGLSDSNANFTGEFNGTSTSSGFLNGNVAAKDDAPATFTFENAATGNKGALKNEILNEFDDTLPATGGMGTVLFTAGGISVVLIAGALFVMYMKKRNSEEEE